MDALGLASATSALRAAAISIAKTTALPSGRRTRSAYFRRKPKLLVFASNEPEFNKRLQMELKSGRFTGKDPKLTPPKMQVKATSSVDGLNLVAPVPKRGVKYEYSDEPSGLEKRKPSLVVGEPKGNVKRSIPSVTLRKPTVYKEEGVEEKPSGWMSGPSSSLKTSNAPSAQRFNDMASSRKPESVEVSDCTQLGRPEAVQTRSNLDMENEQFEIPEVQLNDNAEQSGLRGTSESRERENATNGENEIDRLMGAIDDLLSSKQSNKGLQQVSIGSLPTSPLKDLEDAYWTRAEELVEKRKWEKVELISASTRGFVASFGPLVGFLPYNNLSMRWKFLAFETWLRRKGLDPSVYREKLRIIQSCDAANMNSSPQFHQKVEGGISPDMQLEDLVKIHYQQKIKFLSSFIGQTPSVCVVMADRKSRKLVFSLRPRKDDELVEKKRSLMAKLQIGDVVKCCIKKMAYYGVLVEMEGVPALIHHTEVSWEATSDPSSHFKIGQILEAKVHQLNFEYDRIFLSLKEMTQPDPSSHTLDGRIQADTEAFL